MYVNFVVKCLKVILHCGGIKNNVIPTVAEATINFRILPGETIESTKQHIIATVSDKIKVEPVGFLTNPSPVSRIDSDAFKNLERTIRATFSDAVVVPGLVGGGTDARYFYELIQKISLHFMELMKKSLKKIIKRLLNSPIISSNSSIKICT